MPLLLEVRMHCLGALVERSNVDVHDAFVFRLWDIEAGLGVVHDACIIDHNVQALIAMGKRVSKCLKHKVRWAERCFSL